MSLIRNHRFYQPYIGKMTAMEVWKIPEWLITGGAGLFKRPSSINPFDGFGDVVYASFEKDPWTAYSQLIRIEKRKFQRYKFKVVFAPHIWVPAGDSQIRLWINEKSSKFFTHLDYSVSEESIEHENELDVIMVAVDGNTTLRTNYAGFTNAYLYPSLYESYLNNWFFSDTKAGEQATIKDWGVENGPGKIYEAADAMTNPWELPASHKCPALCVGQRSVTYSQVAFLKAGARYSLEFYYFKGKMFQGAQQLFKYQINADSFNVTVTEYMKITSFKTFDADGTNNLISFTGLSCQADGPFIAYIQVKREYDNSELILADESLAVYRKIWRSVVGGAGRYLLAKEAYSALGAEPCLVLNSGTDQNSNIRYRTFVRPDVASYAFRFKWAVINRESVGNAFVTVFFEKEFQQTRQAVNAFWNAARFVFEGEGYLS